MSSYFVVAAIVAVIAGFLVGFAGCNMAYKPDVNIENADIKHQSGYNAGGSK